MGSERGLEGIDEIQGLAAKAVVRQPGGVHHEAVSGTQAEFPQGPFKGGNVVSEEPPNDHGFEAFIDVHDLC
jgi:hypothetical protein